jgi:hypothetical protein
MQRPQHTININMFVFLDLPPSRCPHEWSKLVGGHYIINLHPITRAHLFVLINFMYGLFVFTHHHCYKECTDFYNFTEYDHIAGLANIGWWVPNSPHNYIRQFKAWIKGVTVTLYNPCTGLPFCAYGHRSQPRMVYQT